MNVKRLLGLDTHADRYAYTVDPVAGFVSAQRASERWVATTCGYCSVGCGMYIGVKGGRAVSVRGNPDHPVNRGMLCPKGLSEHHTIAADGRARNPLLKQNGRFAPVSWRQALGTMAAKFREVQAKHGPGAVGVISTGQLVTEEFYALGKLVQLGLGTPNYDGNTTLCMSTAVSGYKRSFGSDGPPGAYEDLERADVILLIGANIADNHPILCRRLEANPGTTLIVVDPRVTKTAMMADLHLPIRPRSDLALLNGLIHIVIERDLVDREYLERHTVRIRGAARVGARVHARAGLRRSPGSRLDQLDRTAGLYAGARAAFIAWTMGVNHSSKGTETVNAINNLALITGNIGRAGAAPFSITGQCNAMGTREAGGASCLPGYRKFESAADREEIAALWNIPVERIPTARGLAYPDIIEAALDRRIRALWIIATNPIVSFPNLGVLQQSLEGPRLPRRPGWVPSNADHGAGSPRAARRDLGREGRHLYQLRAPRQQSQSRCRASGGGAPGLRHLSRSRCRARGTRRSVPGLVHAARCLRGVEACVGRATLRLLGDDLRSDRGARRDSVAVSARRDRTRAIASPVHRRSLPDRRWPGAAAFRCRGNHSPSSRRASSRWC